MASCSWVSDSSNSPRAPLLVAVHLGITRLVTHILRYFPPNPNLTLYLGVDAGSPTCTSSAPIEPKTYQVLGRFFHLRTY